MKVSLVNCIHNSRLAERRTKPVVVKFEMAKTEIKRSRSGSMIQLRRLRKRNIGQGMTEYIIIVALIAVAAIGAFKFFGETMRFQVAGLSAELSGGNAADQIDSSQRTAGQANGEAEDNKGLGNYAGGNLDGRE